jgi:thiol-disulfide isomerase/thioredoxin
LNVKNVYGAADESNKTGSECVYACVRHRNIFILLFLLFFSSLDGQAVREIGSDALEALCYKKNDTTYVVNFWATWCSPCVREIGHFEELHRQASDSGLKVILVSLDFPNTIERRVIPFLKEKDITAEVVLVNDLDYNAWIERIDPSWSGAIPATLIYNRDKRLFLEKELAQDELVNHVTQIMR